MRILKLATVAWTNRDISTIAILSTVMAIMVWHIVFSTTPAAQQCLIERFHLQTQPFPLWAVFQLVPSMYNLENEVQFQSDRPMSEQAMKFAKPQYINHFPFRIVTFFDGRFCLLSEGNTGILSVKSRYRQQAIETRWRLEPEASGTIRVRAVE